VRRRDAASSSLHTSCKRRLVFRPDEAAEVSEAFHRREMSIECWGMFVASQPHMHRKLSSDLTASRKMPLLQWVTSNAPGWFKRYRKAHGETGILFLEHPFEEGGCAMCEITEEMSVANKCLRALGSVDV
jgi:hypothetical protein